MKKDSAGVKERPILFSGPMVRAILGGRKTQMRRIVKPQPEGEPYTTQEWARNLASARGICLRSRPTDQEIKDKGDRLSGWLFPFEKDNGIRYGITCPFGRAGGRLWVRETLNLNVVLDTKTGEQSVHAYYAATGRSGGSFPWEGDDTRETIPSIHMPRWASRITLEITGVRVERLQDINEADARSEGVEPLFTEVEIEMAPDCYMEPMPYKNYLWHGNIGRSITAKQSDEWAYQFSDYKSALDSFSSLWESINGPGSWDANPWVWVIEFRRVNADELEGQ